MFNNSLIKKLKQYLAKPSYELVIRDLVRVRDIDLSGKVLTTDRFTEHLSTDLVEPEFNSDKLLVIAPHQDDETIGAGGTLIKAANDGAEIVCIYLTDGGMASDEIPEGEMSKIREKEARNVWDEIGGEPIFFGFPDGGLPLSKEASIILAEQINKRKPDKLFIPFLLDNHPDHRRANHLFWLSKDDIDNNDIEVWAYQVWSGLIPNIAVDISDVMDRKNQINSMWISQNKLRDFVHLSKGMSAHNSKYIQTNKPIYCEIFFVVPIGEYFKLCEIYFDRDPIELYSDHELWIKRTNFAKMPAQ